jgi:hypothetical protein
LRNNRTKSKRVGTTKSTKKVTGLGRIKKAIKTYSNLKKKSLAGMTANPVGAQARIKALNKKRADTAAAAKKAKKPMQLIKTANYVKGRHAGKGTPGMRVQGKAMGAGVRPTKVKKKITKVGGGNSGNASHFGRN